MRLLYFCTRWGYEQIPWDDFCRQVKAAGYNGVETSLPLDEAEVATILTALEKHSLKLIAVQWDTGTPVFDDYAKEYQLRLKAAAATKPLFITSHTGKDFFSFAQNEQLLDMAQAISEKTGVRIIHETHRGKFSFAAHITREYLLTMPWLRLTLDISHWFAVAESYLADQAEAVELALQHTDHIHARIGYAHGPQVSDPRSPEWEAVVQSHLLLWDRVIALQKNQGNEWFTITPEFGPRPYMQLQPFTDRPLADQWEVNTYMMKLLKDRYQ